MRVGTEPTGRHLLVVWYPADPHLAIREVTDDAPFVLT